LLREEGGGLTSTES